MATTLISGPRSWKMTRDEEGHREYVITHLVKGASNDGPFNALRTVGLPLPGNMWNFGIDVDIWAWCKNDATVTPVHSDEPNYYFIVEQTFTTKPTFKCQDIQIENPLLQPQRVSGSFNKITLEASHDRFGRPMLTSSFELHKGPQLEYEYSKPVIQIEQNVALLQAELINPMVNTLNDRTLWGMPARTIKFSDFSWEKRYHGVCFSYYTRRFSFDVSAEGFDRYLVDAGTKALSGKWTIENNQDIWKLTNINGAVPVSTNPTHFNRYQDRNGNLSTVLLDGAGRPFTPALNALINDPCEVNPNLTTNKTYSRWRVSGAGLEEEVVLVSTGDCTWTFTGDILSAELDTYGLLTDGFATLEITYLQPGQDVLQFYCTKKSWKNYGPNVMVDLDNTRSVTLTGGSSPGGTGFQKYNESNFYLLGVPIVL